MPELAPHLPFTNHHSSLLFRQYSRSPPPLQHPRPQHPPTQIPSTSPPPDLHPHSRGSTFAATPDINLNTDYQRFSSPPVHAGQQQQHQHHFQSANPYGQSLPDSYVPSGLSGGAVPAYGVPQGQQQQSYYGGSPVNAGDGSAGAGGGQPWMNAMGAMGAMGSAAAGGQWPGMNDATTQMGMQFGAQALGAGQAYLDKNVSRLLPLAHLKHSFDVTHAYVARKLLVVLWPWRHKSWARQVQRSDATGVGEGWKSPREDINCPDLYIPFMALCTYILMSSVARPAAVVASGKAVKGFDPSHLGNTASSAFGIAFLEFLCLKLGTYLLGIGEEGTVVDLVAYEGYKFVG